MLLASLLFLNALYILNVSIQWHHLVTVGVIGIAGFFIIWWPRKFSFLKLLPLLLLSAPLLLAAILLRHTEELLYLGAYLGTVIALRIIGQRQKTLSVSVLFLFVLFGVLPDTVISRLRGPIAHDDPNAASKLDIDPTLIPTPSSHWRINLGPYGTTYHYTSDLGVVLFAVALASMRARGERDTLFLNCLLLPDCLLGRTSGDDHLR